jgi:hypothetical protein
MRIKRNERGSEVSCLQNIEKVARNGDLTLATRKMRKRRRRRK